MGIGNAVVFLGWGFLGEGDLCGGNGSIFWFGLGGLGFGFEFVEEFVNGHRENGGSPCGFVLEYGGDGQDGVRRGRPLEGDFMGGGDTHKSFLGLD